MKIVFAIFILFNFGAFAKIPKSRLQGTCVLCFNGGESSESNNVDFVKDLNHCQNFSKDKKSIYTFNAGGGQRYSCSSDLCDKDIEDCSEKCTTSYKLCRSKVIELKTVDVLKCEKKQKKTSDTCLKELSTILEKCKTDDDCENKLIEEIEPKCRLKSAEVLSKCLERLELNYSKSFKKCDTENNKCQLQCKKKSKVCSGVKCSTKAKADGKGTASSLRKYFDDLKQAIKSGDYRCKSHKFYFTDHGGEDGSISTWDGSISKEEVVRLIREFKDTLKEKQESSKDKTYDYSPDITTVNDHCFSGQIVQSIDAGEKSCSFSASATNEYAFTEESFARIASNLESSRKATGGSCVTFNNVLSQMHFKTSAYPLTSLDSFVLKRFISKSKQKPCELTTENKRLKENILSIIKPILYRSAIDVNKRDEIISDKTKELATLEDEYKELKKYSVETDFIDFQVSFMEDYNLKCTQRKIIHRRCKSIKQDLNFIKAHKLNLQIKKDLKQMNLDQKISDDNLSTVNEYLMSCYKKYALGNEDQGKILSVYCPEESGEEYSKFNQQVKDTLKYVKTKHHEKIDKIGEYFSQANPIGQTNDLNLYDFFKKSNPKDPEYKEFIKDFKIKDSKGIIPRLKKNCNKQLGSSLKISEMSLIDCFMKNENSFSEIKSKIKDKKDTIQKFKDGRGIITSVDKAYYDFIESASIDEMKQFLDINRCQDKCVYE